MELHPSSAEVLTRLHAERADAPLLCLGQTVWWDEPMKAVFCRMMEELGLSRQIVLGVHDTDYFAKGQVSRKGLARFELLAHNDGTTKGLWSAAGEISRLFGSETIPSRHELMRHHVPVDRLARASGDPQGFVDRETEAWGWRGLVYTGGRDLIVHTLPLREMGDSVERMLRWGFEGTIESVVDECCRREAGAAAERLLQWVAEYREQNPDATLSALYQDLLPRLFGLLLGEAPANYQVACTAHLLRLNRETAGLPRFRFVDLFLRPETAKLAAEAYDRAVAGSEIYTLDRFGLGAVPFDLVIPGHGRGTLRVTLRALHVETRKPIRIPLKRPVHSVDDLAGVLEREFGEHVTLVGKAVALISMLAHEFIFVFNEEGSGYVSRTRAMNDHLAAHGHGLSMNPILRLRYHTWDALDGCASTLKLPLHLASAFEDEELPAADLARRWRGVVTEQRALLDRVRAIRKPRELMAFFAEQAGDGWSERLSRYEAAREELRKVAVERVVPQAQVRNLYSQLAGVKQQIVDAEREKATHFRSVMEWSPDAEAVREEHTAGIDALLARRLELLGQIDALKARRLAVERSPHAMKLRDQIGALENEASLERLRLVRDAILTVSGLPHTDHRPSAWWFPLVDRTGRWFRRIVETTEVYTEPLLSPQ